MKKGHQLKGLDQIELSLKTNPLRGREVRNGYPWEGVSAKWQRR